MKRNNSSTVPASSLAALLSDAPLQGFGNPCGIQRIIDGLPEEYKTALTEQMSTRSRDGGPTDFDIYKRMTLAGFKTSPSAINRHRSNQCICLKGNN